MPTVKEIKIQLSEIVAQSEGAAALIRSVLLSAADSLQKGKMEDASRLLEPVFTIFSRISAVRDLINGKIGGAAGEQEIMEVSAGERLRKVIERLHSSVESQDWLQASDLLAYELSPAFDAQITALRARAAGMR